MNAECRELRPLLSAYMDNELTPDELRVVQAHVSTCADCAAVLREYRQVRSSMRALSQPVPPPELRAAVFAKATPAYRRRAAVVTFGQRGLSYAALAAATIAIFLTAALLLRSGVGTAIMGAPDNTPPRIDRLEPQPNVDAWGLNKPIRITFSEPMDRASVQAALELSANPPLSEEEHRQLLQSVKWDGNTLIIGEGVALQPYTDYTVTIAANRAQDAAHNPLQATTEYTFRTVDVVTAAQTPTAIVAVAPPSPSPTATARPTEASTASTNAVPPSSPSPTARPTDAPAVAINPTPTSAAAFTPPPTTAPVQPTSTPTTPKPPTPTATAAAPTATPQPTSTPTQAPPTPTVPAPTATTPPPTATSTPVRSPYAVGQAFAPVYAAAAETLGLPTANEATVQGSYLAFEGGWMIWRGDTRTIYVLFNENPLVWYAFADGWVDGMEPGGGPATKAGRYLPPRGFNKVWTENPDVQRRLGFALTPNETGGTITIQPFERGLMLASNLGTPTVYIFYQNNLFEAYPR